MSDDEKLTNDFLGSAIRTDFADQTDLEVDDDSWDLGCETEKHPDAWDVQKDPNAIGYGANGTLPFLIFGTSADDESAKPHVLSPPLMERLENFLPFGVSEQKFWMDEVLPCPRWGIRALAPSTHSGCPSHNYRA